MRDLDLCEKILSGAKDSFSCKDLIWVILILCLTGTIYFFRLLWCASETTDIFSLHYTCSKENLVEFLFLLLFPLTFFLTVRFLFKGDPGR